LLIGWGAYNERFIPWWQRMILKAIYPFFQVFVNGMLELSPNAAEESLQETLKACKEFEELFADGRKYVLGTDGPTFADFALAAEIGTFYCHPKYGGK